MLLKLVLESMGLLITRPFRAILLRSVLLTVMLLACFYFALLGIVDGLVDLPFGFVADLVGLMLKFGLFIGLIFLITPVTSLFVGLYVDDVAQLVERERYPHDRVGVEQPFWASVMRSLRFSGLVLLVNLIALILFLVFGLGFFIFLIANAYLLGREFFDLVALRYVDEETSIALQQRHRGTLFLAGFVLALLLWVPLFNVLVPLLGSILFVHLFKALNKERLAQAEVTGSGSAKPA